MLRTFARALAGTIAALSISISLPALAAGPETLTFTSQLVDGKKIWLPAEGKAKAGSDFEITLINKLKEHHGFLVPGYLEDVVVAPNETKVVKVKAMPAGTYEFSCQLHPAHRGGKIVLQ